MDTYLTLKNIKEKYIEYLNLYYVKSREDPEEEPYRTKYQARELIKNLLVQIETANLENNENEKTSEFLASSSQNDLTSIYNSFVSQLKTAVPQNSTSRKFLISKLLEFNLSRNFMDTEEPESGERLLAKIVREIDELDKNSGLKYNPLTINLKLCCFNDLVYVWSSRAEYKRCLTLMQAIEETYAIFKSAIEEEKQTPPFDPSELIELNSNLTVEKRRSSFESLYTHSLFYFAQVYGKLDEKDKSAKFCQLTLQRQIEDHLAATTSVECNTGGDGLEDNFQQQPQEKVVFNPLDWATHSAAISQYYMCEGDFPTARHCLCCAEAILNKLNAEKTESDFLKEQTASIKRCWGKYAIELMKTSRKKLLDDSINSKKLVDEIDKVSKFRFRLSESEYKLADCENNAITSNMTLDYEQARGVFLKAQKILNETKEFFKLDGYVTDHCEILRDLSDLYTGLIFFEEDSGRKCKMHKRRLDLLQHICEELNEQYYLTLKRQLLFDCGSILSEMLDLKIDMFKTEMSTSTRERIDGMKKKINQMVEDSLQYFEKFLTTMKVQPARDQLPDKFDEHNVRPALLAKFYIGRLYSKFIVVEPSKKLENMKHTLESYKYLVDYCDRQKNEGDDDPINQMINEYNVCKEMIFLLPNEMEKVRLTII